MAIDTTLKVVAQVEGQQELERLQAVLVQERQDVANLSAQLQALAAAGQQLSPQFAQLTQQQQQHAQSVLNTTRAITAQNQQLGMIQHGSLAAVGGLRSMSYILDDLQYIGTQGLRPILNNLMMVSPYAFFAGLALDQLSRNILPKLMEAGSKATDPLLTGLDHIKERIEEINKKPIKLTGDRMELDFLKQRQEELEKGTGFLDKQKTKQSHAEAQASGLVQEQITEGIPGGSPLREAIEIARRARQSGALAGDSELKGLTRKRDEWMQHLDEMDRPSVQTPGQSSAGELVGRSIQRAYDYWFQSSTADKNQGAIDARKASIKKDVDAQIAKLEEKIQTATGAELDAAIGALDKIVKQGGGVLDVHAIRAALGAKRDAAEDASLKAHADAQKEIEDEQLQDFKENGEKLLKALEQGHKFDVSEMSKGTLEQQQEHLKSAIRRLDESSSEWLGMLANLDPSLLLLDEGVKKFRESIDKALEGMREQLEQKRRQLETDELNKQGQAGEVAGAKEIAGAQRHTDTLKARKSRQQNLTVQMGTQAWGAEMGGVMAASAARGEKESKTDARLTGEIAERLQGLVPEDQRWDMAQRIVDAARDQYSDQAMQNRMMFGPSADPGTMMRMAQAGKLGPEGRAMAQMARGQGAGGAAMKQWAAKNRHWAEMEQDQFDKKFGPFMGKDFKPEAQAPELELNKDIKGLSGVMIDNTKEQKRANDLMEKGVPALMS